LQVLDKKGPIWRFTKIIERAWQLWLKNPHNAKPHRRSFAEQKQNRVRRKKLRDWLRD
jgi:hypothetical protein